MKKTAIQTTDFIRDFEALTKNRAEGSPAWFKDFRAASLERFTQNGIPTTKDEEWKYTNVAALAEKSFTVLENGALVASDELSAYLSKDEIRLVFVNGHYSPELSSPKTPEGLTITALKDALAKNEADIKPVLEKFKDMENSFAALNTTLLSDGAFIRVDANKHITPLIHIVHVASAAKGSALFLPRTVLSVGKSAQASIIESHVAFDDKLVYFANACSDIYLDENATLHYAKAQKESLKAVHVGNTRVWQETNSNLLSISVVCGAGLTRNNIDIILNGEGINSTLDGLYSTYEHMHVDNHTSVDHRFPNCQSNQLYKGILNEKSRAVFNGKIFVRDIAQKTNSYQLNKNLLLGRDCRVDTKPQLEIFADDVKCTHGATIGQLNEDELFYLQTRGVPRKDAVRLLARGFAEDLLDTLKEEEMVRKLHILLAPSFARF